MMRSVSVVCAAALLGGAGACMAPLDADCLGASHDFVCASNATTLHTDAGDRVVHSRLPPGEPPTSGFPAVVAFQGSGFPAEMFFESRTGMPFGGDVQGRVVQALLQDGFAVVAPDAQGFGHGYWDTNVVGRADDWSHAPDDALMHALLAAISDGALGPIDTSGLLAMGISSGGYMTSRMAVSYPGRFSALAIMAGSYATCSGVLCTVPAELPADHPATLFLHGELDAVVPMSTMLPYAAALDDAGVAVEVVTAPNVGHAWIEAAVTEVPAFFTHALGRAPL